jgi:hypothetical protein
MMILDEESEIVLTIDTSYFQNLRSNDVRDSSLRTSYLFYFKGLKFADLETNTNQVFTVDNQINQVTFLDYDPYMRKIGNFIDLPLNKDSVFLYC